MIQSPITMTPEQVLREILGLEKVDSDPSVDIYSVGILVLSLIRGSPPPKEFLFKVFRFVVFRLT